jgi:hypothetical protein
MNGNVVVSTQGARRREPLFEKAQQARWNGKADTTIGMPDNNSLWPGDAGRQGSS